uniref:Uncharacterized protein n=1 Tax=Setaria viridis TaxID=4556 RepID=A0A4U6VTW9_SETVI|nr:hypothetical protein SEVIR_2G229550v2 [Setaria viridis]
MPQAVQVGEREGAVDPKSETIFCQIEINQTYFHKDYTISFSYFKWYRPINQNQSCISADGCMKKPIII